MKPSAAAAAAALAALALACASPPEGPPSGPPAGLGGGPVAADTYTLVGERSFLDGHPATNADGTVNVVVEIPAGTSAKWEVDKHDGTLRWEFRQGAPRVVRYLPYPANYGMVPSTLLPAELGGDGDPLDVVVLCPALPRGAVVRARLVGVLELLDGGEQDDKLLAVVEESPLGHVDDLAELDLAYPGITAILEGWFTGYKGPGVMESRGFADVGRARAILEAAAREYEERSGPR